MVHDFLAGYKPKFNLDDNLTRLTAQYPQNPDYEHALWSLLAMPVHGTTIDRLEKIVASGHIYAHRRLAQHVPTIHTQRLQNATDALDISLGLDHYVFLNIGRIHPGDLRKVYLCFNNNLIDQPRTLVALQEITHFGGIVSPEAARVERHYNPTINIEQKNKSVQIKILSNNSIK